MSPQLECPNCGASLFPQEWVRRECVICGHRLSDVPIRAPLEEGPARHADEPMFLPEMPPPQALAMVRKGVTLVRWGLACGLILGVFAGLAQYATVPVPAGPLAHLLRQGVALAGVFGAIAALVVFLGVCFCCAVPRGGETATWARFLISTLVLGGLLVLILAAVFVFHPASPDRAEPSWLDETWAIAFVSLLFVGFFGWLCFYLLLAALARLFGGGRLARGFGTHFASTVAALFLGVVGGCLAFVSTGELLSGSEHLILASALWFGWLALGAGLTSWFLVLLTRLYRLIPAPDGAPRGRVDRRPAAPGWPSGGRDERPAGPEQRS